MFTILFHRMVVCSTHFVVQIQLQRSAVFFICLFCFKIKFYMSIFVFFFATKKSDWDKNIHILLFWRSSESISRYGNMICNKKINFVHTIFIVLSIEYWFILVYFASKLSFVCVLSPSVLHFCWYFFLPDLWTKNEPNLGPLEISMCVSGY